MIKNIEDNDIVACINFMLKSCKDNDYFMIYNERAWIEHLNQHVLQAGEGNPHYLAIKDVDKDGNLLGFMLASSYVGFYGQQIIMDVKDCIIDVDRNNLFTVTRLFNHMIDHTEKHGGKLWRADSARAPVKAEEYVTFLAKKYNATPFTGVIGEIGG